MYGLKELALVCSQLGSLDPLHEACVLVDEPRLAQHIGRSVLELYTHTTPRSILTLSRGFQGSTTAPRTYYKKWLKNTI